MNTLRSLFLFLCLAVLLPAAARGADREAAPEPRPCGPAPSLPCLVEAAGALVDAGDPRSALDLLKAHRALGSESRVFTVRMAQAYLALDNRVWARRTLAAWTRSHPGDCEAQAWLAWVAITDGDLRSARLSLEAASCDEGSPEASRVAVLRARVETEDGAPQAAEAPLRRAQESPALFEEDRALLDRLSRRLYPHREPPIQGSLELALGWTANPLLGSPLDPTKSADEASSPMGEAKAWFRFGYPLTPWFFPFLEPSFRAQGFTDAQARDLSYFTFSLRPGVTWAFSGLALRTAFKTEALLLAGGDRYDGGPMWFSQGNRGELELDIGHSLSVFGGVGHRSFRSLGRTRLEADLGAGGGWSVHERVFLLAALTGRLHRATNAAYHLWGGTALAALRVRMGAGLSVKTTVSGSLDTYPDSAGFFGTDRTRRDGMVKGDLGLWWAPAGGARVQVGLSYQPSHRFSTSSRYEFTDHRVLAQLRWSFQSDPLQPASIGPEGRVPLDYGLGASGSDMSERIQELLRQDEETQSGSSCLD